jgi:hypothetical protein
VEKFKIKPSCQLGWVEAHSWVLLVPSNKIKKTTGH